jgi:DNA-directed RNA polymerase specialized sigma24 family protein
MGDDERDRALIEAARRGSAPAVRELFERHWRDLWRSAFVIVGDESAAVGAADRRQPGDRRAALAAPAGRPRARLPGALGVPAGTVASRISRGISHLRSTLEVQRAD